MGKRKESHATAGRSNSQSPQKDPPKVTAWRHETWPVNASGAANSSTRAPHSPSAVATIATLRAMCPLPVVRFMSRQMHSKAAQASRPGQHISGRSLGNPFGMEPHFSGTSRQEPGTVMQPGTRCLVGQGSMEQMQSGACHAPMPHGRHSHEQGLASAENWNNPLLLERGDWLPEAGPAGSALFLQLRVVAMPPSATETVRSLAARERERVRKVPLPDAP
jgi:hypothetical protein